MSIVERLKKIKNLTPVLEVPLVLGDDENAAPELVLQVERLNRSMMSGPARVATLGAKDAVKNIENEEDAKRAQSIAWGSIFISEMVPLIRRATKGWTHTPAEGDPVEYSADARDALFSDLTASEGQRLVANYQDVALADEAAAAGNQNGVLPVGGKGSKSESAKRSSEAA